MALNNRPEVIPNGVEIDKTRNIISCTRDALSELGDWCSRTAQALGLTLIVTTGASNALAQSAPPTQVATISVPTGNPSASVPTSADKGGLQVIRIDGKEYTLHEIATMKEDEQLVLIGSIKNPLEKIKVGNYITRFNIEKGKKIDEGTQAAINANKGKAEAQQAAINANKGKAEAQQAAINANKGKAEAQQAAIEHIGSKVPELVQNMERLLSSGAKLQKEDRVLLENISQYGKPPDWMPRVKKILSNPQNFA